MKKMFAINKPYIQDLKQMAENNQNIVNRIEFNRTYSPSTYQTTSGFNHNNNNNTML